MASCHFSLCPPPRACSIVEGSLGGAAPWTALHLLPKRRPGCYGSRPCGLDLLLGYPVGGVSSMRAGAVEGPVIGVVVVVAATDVVSLATDVVSAAADVVSACRIIANALVLSVSGMVCPSASPSRPLGLSVRATTTTATATLTTAAPTCFTAMASLRVLAFDHEGRPIHFDTWLDDLRLYLLSDSKDSVSLFDLASGADPAPPATAESATRSQWLTSDAAARLAIRNHLPLAECAHFGQHRTAQALYDAVVAHYSSPATAALGRLLLPYLFPELSALTTVEDLVSHLRTSDARYRATVPAEGHFLSLDPTSLTINLLEQDLLAAETSAVAVGAACGTPRPLFFEGCSPSPLAPSYASAAAADVPGPLASSYTSAAAAHVPGAGDVGAAFASAKRRSGKGKGSRGGGGGSGSGGGGSGGGSGGSGGGGSGGSGGGSGGVGGGDGGSGGSGGSGGGGTDALRGGSGGGQRQQQQRRSETQRRSEAACFCPTYSLSSKGKGGKGGGGGSGGGGGGSGSSGGGSSGGGGGGGTGGGSGGSRGGGGGSGGSGGSGSSEAGGGGTGARRVGYGDLLRSRIAIFDLDFDAILSAMYALSVSAEGDCYRFVPPNPGIAAATLGASESGTLRTTMPAQALHTCTRDSNASACFFRDITTLTPLSTPVPVRLADPSGGPVVACSSTVLPCLAVPSGSLSSLHLPSFSTNLASTAALQDAMVTTTTPRGQRVTICTCTRTSRHLATFTCRPGSSLYTLATKPPQVAASAQMSASLPPLPPSPAPPCLPCIEGWQRAAPHSSFPPTSAPLQALHMNVWGPACVTGQGRKSYFLLVVDDYTRYTTVFPLRSKGQDLPVLRLHSNRGGEFSSNLLQDFCHGEGILQSFTLSDSPEQSGIAEHRIGLVMEVARTSMIHAAAPHFMWLFAVWHTAHQLNLWPRVSLPKTLPILRLTGEVRDASVFRVWGSRAFVRDTSADKLSARAIPYVFLGFPPDAPGWQFYHPTSRRVFPSQDATFDELVPFYRLFPYRSAPPPPPPLFLAPGPPQVDPLPPQGPALSGVSQIDPLLGPAPFQVAFGSGAARGAASGGAEPGGVEFEGDGSTSAEPRDEEPVGAELGGSEPGGEEPVGAEPVGVEPEGAERGGAESGVAEPRATRVGGAGVTTGVGITGAGGAGAGGAGAEGARAVDHGAGGAGDTVRLRPYFIPLLQHVLGVPSSTSLTPPLLCPPPDQSQLPLQPASPLPAPSPYTEQSGGLTERHEPASRPVSPFCTARRVPRSRPPHVPGTHAKALHPSSVPLRVPLPAPPESSLPEVPDPESDRAHAISPTIARLLATTVIDPSFESAAASALVAELLDFAAACRLDYATALIADSDLQRPVYGLRQVPCEWHDTLTTTLAALGFAPATADPLLFLRTDTSLPPFYVLVYIDALVFATADIEALTLVKSVLQKRHTCIDLGELRCYLGLQITRDRACTLGMGLVLGGRGPLVLTGHADASWVDDSAMQRLSQGYTFSLGSCSVSWRSTRSSLVLSSSCEAEIYAGAMAAQELRWLTYLLSDLGEQPCSPPVLYVYNKAMIALSQEHRLEHRTKHMALRYFLARELQQRGHLRLAYVATRANTADVFTKALPLGDHQRFSTVLGLVPTLPHLLTA
ncbi:unnamed protein product [Closterium sp. NIES-54]